jgi:hypothetical protein
MQYLPNITNDPVQRYRVCMCIALPTVDSITSATLRSCCICYHYLIILKKEKILVIIVKVEGRKQLVGLSI